jgi:hypothetical protein
MLAGKTFWLALLAALSQVAFAQGEQSWDNLSRLRAGQRIEVTDTKLRSTEGSFTGYTGDAISLRLDRGEVSIARSDVFSIKNREASHRRRNVLLGLAIGAAGGLAAGGIRGATYHEAGETGVFMLVYTPIVAGIGAGLGAALPAGPVTVYRAKAPIQPPVR